MEQGSLVARMAVTLVFSTTYHSLPLLHTMCLLQKLAVTTQFCHRSPSIYSRGKLFRKGQCVSRNISLTNMPLASSSSMVFCIAYQRVARGQRLFGISVTTLKYHLQCEKSLHLARLYIDWSTIGAFPLSHLRFRVSGKELATTSCHIVGVT